MPALQAPAPGGGLFADGGTQTPVDEKRTDNRLAPLIDNPVDNRGGTWRCLFWLPLWRGSAVRTGRGLLAGGLTLISPLAGMVIWPAAAGWWLAGLALAGLVVVSRLDSLSRQEFSPLWLGCAMLPFDRAGLWRARQALAMAPLAPALAGLCFALPREGLRAGVAAAYASTLLLSALAQVRSAGGRSAHRSSRWLFSLVLLVALASEVMV